MEDLIIIGIIAVVVAIDVIYTVKHFKGEGGCCGGGSFKPRKKKLKNIRYSKTFFVRGMHCKHCKERVEEVVNDLSGVSGKVDLGSGCLTVFYAEDIDDETIKARLKRAGYDAEAK